MPPPILRRQCTAAEKGSADHFDPLNLIKGRKVITISRQASDVGDTVLNRVNPSSFQDYASSRRPQFPTRVHVSSYEPPKYTV